MTDHVEIVRPLLPFAEVRANAEAEARRWCPFAATSEYGRRIIEQAGESAVRREYERRARSTAESRS